MTYNSMIGRADAAALSPTVKENPPMAENENKKEEAAPDAGDQAPEVVQNAHAEKVVAKEEEQGFRGIEVDPTPNEHYTLTGVGKGLPTPETDDDAAAKAAHAVRTAGLAPAKKAK